MGSDRQAYVAISLEALLGFLKTGDRPISFDSALPEDVEAIAVEYRPSTRELLVILTSSTFVWTPDHGEIPRLPDPVVTRHPTRTEFVDVLRDAAERIVNLAPGSA